MAVSPAQQVLLFVVIISVFFFNAVTTLNLSKLYGHLSVKRNGEELCRAYEPFRCPGNGACISIQYLCDGAPDCADGYDEDSKLCTAGRYSCRANFGSDGGLCYHPGLQIPNTFIPPFPVRIAQHLLVVLAGQFSLPEGTKDIILAERSGGRLIWQSLSKFVLLLSVVRSKVRICDWRRRRFTEETFWKAKRPPVEETASFLQSLLASHGPNYLEKLFGTKAREALSPVGGVKPVAIALSESQTIEDFGAALHLMRSDLEHLRSVFMAVENGDLGMLKSLGIKDSELGDVKFFLEKLVNTGFLD